LFSAPEIFMPRCLAALLVAGLVGCSNHADAPNKDDLRDAEYFSRKAVEVLDTDPPKAVEWLSKSLTLTPNAPKVIYYRALANANAGLGADAAADVDHLEHVNPQIGKKLRSFMKAAAGGMKDLAHRHLEEKRYDEAIRKCDIALAYDPHWGDAYAIKG